jgi:hypothetical protein
MFIGTGKSYLIDTTTQKLTRDNDGRMTVLVVAPTGVAAFNVSGW